MVGIQIALGAWVRHFPSPWAAGVHAFVAAAVLGQGAGLFWRVRRGSAGRDDQPLRRPALAMAIILGIQVVLGLAALVILWPFDGIARSFSTPQAMIRTGHQANGALLLASVVVLSLRILRHRYRLPVSEAGAVVSPVVASGTSEILA
jgi:cytochrome c oxidase assembly protein subunit 15